jgi:hypothetical protein
MTFLAHPTSAVLAALSRFEDNSGADSGTRTLMGVAIVLLVIGVCIGLGMMLTNRGRT